MRTRIEPRRAARITEIAAALAAGTYRVDHEQVAARMLATVLAAAAVRFNSPRPGG